MRRAIEEAYRLAGGDDDLRQEAALLVVEGRDPEDAVAEARARLRTRRTFSYDDARAVAGPVEPAAARPGVEERAARVLDLIRTHPWTIADLAAATSSSRNQVRASLRAVRAVRGRAWVTSTGARTRPSGVWWAPDGRGRRRWGRAYALDARLGAFAWTRAAWSPVLGAATLADAEAARRAVLAARDRDLPPPAPNPRQAAAHRTRLGLLPRTHWNTIAHHDRASMLRRAIEGFGLRGTARRLGEDPVVVASWARSGRFPLRRLPALAALAGRLRREAQVLRAR